MNPVELDPRTRAAMDTREHIRRVAVTAFGARRLEEPIEGYQVLTRHVLDDPLAGMRAARLVADVAAGELREWALRARGAGRSWDDVADALDVDDEELEGRAPREVAFASVVEPDAFGWPGEVRWTCTSCQARVRDAGPYDLHPEDREGGHAPDCARHAAAVAAWRRAVDHEHDNEHDDEDGEGER